jgi:ubiquinone/menaquinone biosynthesis C-methylase UbiE
MVFVDVGCGNGFFSLLAAEIVGEKGQVFAVDIDAGAIEKLKSEAAIRGLFNIQAMIGPAEEVVFCEGCADIVFFSMVLHDFADPIQVLKNARSMVKQKGKMVNLDWKKMPMPFGPPERIRFSEEKASELVRQAGFTVDSVREVGPYHYIMVGKK